MIYRGPHWKAVWTAAWSRVLSHTAGHVPTSQPSHSQYQLLAIEDLKLSGFSGPSIPRALTGCRQEHVGVSRDIRIIHLFKDRSKDQVKLQMSGHLDPPTGGNVPVLG